MSKVRVGSTFRSKGFGEFKIIEDLFNGRMRVRFSGTGFEANPTVSNIIRGKVKDYYYPNAFGVGFLGAKPSKEDSVARNAWQDLMKRAYSKKWEKKYPTYKGVTTIKAWHDFREFRRWFILNHRPDYHLDKDLLKPGNKVYGPKTCVYLPQRINKIIMPIQMKNIPLSTGVTNKKGKFHSSVKSNGKTIHLGSFDTEKEANQAYKEFKASILKEEIKKPKEWLSQAAIEGLKSLIKRLV